MMLWLILLLLLAGATALMLWPLMRRHAEKPERRPVMIAIVAVLIALPAGGMILYNHLGAPELAGATQTKPAAESDADLAAEAAKAKRAAERDPGVETYNRLGNILFRMGNYDAAAKAYKQAARLGAAGPGQNNRPRN